MTGNRDSLVTKTTLNNSALNNSDRHSEHATHIRRRQRATASETKKRTSEREINKAQGR